jgi:hypothetical protein
MSEAGAHRGRASSLASSHRVRIGAVIALAVAVGVIVWLVLQNSGGSSPTTHAQSNQPVAASRHRLRALATSLGHPLFWLGPEPGYTYELTQTQNGKIYIRYLPHGVKIGSAKPYLTVATYPFPGAFPAIQKLAQTRGAVSVKLPLGGLALLDTGYPESVHVAYPGVNYQIEVYDPTAAAAMQKVAAGHIAVLGNLHGASATPAAPTSAKAASVAQLRALSRSLGHPVYWAGPKPGYTYELSQNSVGAVFIRYLPAGVPVGVPKSNYLIVATYPFPNALAAIRRVAAGAKYGVTRLPGGGLAVVDGQYPKSIHLAFPGSNFQVEVYDPLPSTTHTIVASHKIVPVS